MIIWEYFYPGCSILVGKCHPTFTGERNTLNLYFLDQDNPDKNSFCLISKTKTTWKKNFQLYRSSQSERFGFCLNFDANGRYHDNAVINYGGKATDEVQISTREDFSLSRLWK